MATVFRKTFTKPLPEGAEVHDRRGERCVRWKDAQGKTRTALLTTGRDGTPRILVTARTFTAKYRDGQGIRREVATGCCDETAARQVLADLERRAEKVRSGLRTVAEDAVVDALDTPLREHVEAYIRYHGAKGSADSHINDIRLRMQRLIGECSLSRLVDINRNTIEQWLAKQAAAGLGARSRNAYLQAIRGFCNWCCETNRLVTNPLASIKRVDENADRRRRRRALTEPELRRLLYVARWRPLAEYGRAILQRDASDMPKDSKSRRTWQREPLTFESLDAATDRARQQLKDNPAFIAELERRGQERALVYKTLVLTGLRRAELASLTVGQLQLDDPPALLLEAADEKNREGSTIPLRSDLVADLRDWVSTLAGDTGDSNEAGTVKFDPQAAQLRQHASSDRGHREGHSQQKAAGVPASAAIFHVPRQLVKNLDRDLRVAGIPKRDDRGRTVDVHALRHSFGTLLSKGGVAPRTAQAAMRHSKIDLTMNVYTDPRLLDVAGAMESLPELPLTDRRPEANNHLAATGTTDPSPCPLAPLLAPPTDVRCPAGSSTVTTGESAAPREPAKGRDASCFPVNRKRPLSTPDNERPQRGRRDSNPQPLDRQSSTLTN